jgi:PLP dependent protein
MDAEQIRRRVDQVRQRIRLACERVGRDPDGVTLVAVTKTFPEAVILSAADAGLRHIGENKPQEFARKFEAVAPVLGERLSWHFIGHLQRNKVKLVAGRAHLVHGVDSLRLAQTLNDFAEREDLLLHCLIQVNVSGEESKFGLEPSTLNRFLAEAGALERIAFDGLMTLASPTGDTIRIRKEFRLLRECLSEGRQTVDSLRYLSMGMSGDYEIAVEEGATHVRLGSALFGPREG